MRPRLTHWLLHPRLTVAARIALGLVFIAAALPKIGDPPGFAKAIWAYQLVPGPVLNPMALVLPWLELLCGLALCPGGLASRRRDLGHAAAPGLRPGALHQPRPPPSGGLRLLRRHRPRTENERLADMRWSLLRDAGLLLLCGQVLLASCPQKELTP